MAYVHFNPNPFRLTTDDCTVRAISCAEMAKHANSEAERTSYREAAHKLRNG